MIKNLVSNDPKSPLLVVFPVYLMLRDDLLAARSVLEKPNSYHCVYWVP